MSCDFFWSRNTAKSCWSCLVQVLGTFPRKKQNKMVSSQKCKDGKNQEPRYVDFELRTPVAPRDCWDARAFLNAAWRGSLPGKVATTKT